MRLSDVMGASGLSGYAVASMLLFLLAFGTIVVRVLRRSRAEDERARRLPLDEPAAPGHPAEDSP